jgi:hypothetical protein
MFVVILSYDYKRKPQFTGGSKPGKLDFPSGETNPFSGAGNQLRRRVIMTELAKALQDQIQEVADGKVLVPKKIWDSLLETVEEYGLLKAMEEAKDSPLLTKDEALKYLAELENESGL